VRVPNVRQKKSDHKETHISVLGSLVEVDERNALCLNCPVVCKTEELSHINKYMIKADNVVLSIAELEISSDPSATKL
jgi:hypothetical protein